MSDETTDDTNPESSNGQGIGDYSKPSSSREHEQPIDDTIHLIDAVQPPVIYDADEVRDFIDMVYEPSELRDDENVLCFFDAKAHRKPISKAVLLDKLRRTRQAARLYIATATVTTDEVQQRPLNRKKLFFRFHLLVLDDIGTKVPLSKIPKSFEPTYIIESSPENFQYGYVLEVPIDDYEVARTLVSLTYASGYTDEGGALVNKKVRLPQGVHGKPNSATRDFRTRLVACSGRLWTPEDILKELGISHKWSDILEDAEKVRRQARTVGSSPWSAASTEHETLDGIVDPVVEWLDKAGMLYESCGEFWRIKCPWADLHTLTGDVTDDSAYYSPIGVGDDEFKAYRGFNCFHSHEHKTADFLAYVAINGCVEVPIFDPAAALVSSHVFDATTNSIWDIKTGVFVQNIKTFEAFARVYNKKHKVCAVTYTDTGISKMKYTRVSTALLWDKNPARVTVFGSVYDPTTRARIVMDDNHLRINEFAMPEYGEGAYDQRHVDTFVGYLTKLVPDPEELKVLLDWLAAKMQRMSFRGWGIMMIAKMHGTGRGTLEDILTRLFDSRNCVNVPYECLLGQGDSRKYNEWQAVPLVFTSECEALSSTVAEFYRHYNALKDVVDTTVKQVTINFKFGLKQTRNTYTSHLIFANHEAAAALPPDDRRFYVIQNPSCVPTVAYFSNIRRWMDERADASAYSYCRHVTRWLKARVVDFDYMQGPAPLPPMKEAVIAATKSALDVAFEAALASLPSPFVYQVVMERILLAPMVQHRLGIDPEKIAKVLRLKMEGHTVGLHRSVQVTVGTDGRVRPRARLADVNANPLIGRLTKGKGSAHDKREVRTQLLQIDVKEIRSKVLAALMLEGY